jgi:zinc transport system substrate-binding protein
MGALNAKFALRLIQPARILLAIMFLSLASCSESTNTPLRDQPEDTGRLSVYVVNAPLQTFAERIGGQHVDVVFPAPPKIDPAFWQPSAEVIARYQAADLILENGAGYAKWLRYATLPRASRVNTSAAFSEGDFIERSGTVTHGHGPSGEHSHAGIAFTTWLDPTLAILQARAIAEAMIARRPALAKEFRVGLAKLEVDLLEIDTLLQRASRRYRNHLVLFSHPVYEYFSRRYDIVGESLFWEPGEEPDQREWDRLKLLLADKAIDTLFFEGKAHPVVEARLRTLGIDVVVFEPGGPKSALGDWLAVMRMNVARLEAVE